MPMDQGRGSHRPCRAAPRRWIEPQINTEVLVFPAVNWRNRSRAQRDGLVIPSLLGSSLGPRSDGIIVLALHGHLARGPCRAKSEYTASRRCRSLRRWDGRRLQNVPRRYRGVAQLLERRCAWLKASGRRAPDDRLGSRFAVFSTEPFSDIKHAIARDIGEFARREALLSRLFFARRRGPRLADLCLSPRACLAVLGCDEVARPCA